MPWLRLFTTSYFAIMCFSGWRLLSEVRAAFVSVRWAHAIRRRLLDANRDVCPHLNRREPKMTETPTSFPARPSSYDKNIGLVLQGGGALGSYQAGVYEALASSEYLPDWVAGISIGAINAAIIAGNSPENRVKHLRNFWQGITAHSSLLPSALGESFAAWRQKAS